mmetsp:Transcript_116201/g.217536  ORF Transcript_116201/g.217536 Transcript_116201/m.217536 type:complete len:206 (-) Transcript_116201:354-971(-)
MLLSSSAGSASALRGSSSSAAVGESWPPGDLAEPCKQLRAQRITSTLTTLPLTSREHNTEVHLARSSWTIVSLATSLAQRSRRASTAPAHGPANAKRTPSANLKASASNTEVNSRLTCCSCRTVRGCAATASTRARAFCRCRCPGQAPLCWTSQPTASATVLIPGSSPAASSSKMARRCSSDWSLAVCRTSCAARRAWLGHKERS